MAPRVDLGPCGAIGFAVMASIAGLHETCRLALAVRLI